MGPLTNRSCTEPQKQVAVALLASLAGSPPRGKYVACDFEASAAMLDDVSVCTTF